MESGPSALGAFGIWKVSLFVPSISQQTVYERTVALPPLQVQHTIVAEIEAEQALVAANRELIVRMEKKIQSTLARVWGEEARE
jgi:type I restriction enzyme M protein